MGQKGVTVKQINVMNICKKSDEYTCGPLTPLNTTKMQNKVLCLRHRRHFTAKVLALTAADSLETEKVRPKNGEIVTGKNLI